MSKKQTAGDVVKPLRIPAELHKQIRQVGEARRLSDSKVIEMAIELGLRPLKEGLEQMFDGSTPTQKAA